MTLVVSLFSCDNGREFSDDPFEPNYRATKDNLKSWDFELTTADDGICVYEKKIADNLLVYFYLNFDDQCYLTTGQVFLFDLDTLDFQVTYEEFIDDNYEKWFKSNLAEFKKDSLKIVDVLNKYNAAIVSPVKRLGSSSSLSFRVGKKNSNKDFECTYSAFPQNVKSIDISEMWNEN